MNIIFISIESSRIRELTEELRQKEIKFSISKKKSISNSISTSEIVEIINIAGNATFWVALASVINSYLKNSKLRKVFLKTKTGTNIQVEGFSLKELEKILKDTKEIRMLEFDSKTKSNKTLDDE